MSWKQPIPTDLRNVFGDDHLSRLIYQEFLLMACNSEQVKNVNGQIFKLERGQCFYTTLDLSKIFRTHRNSVVNSIKRLNSLYNRIDNRTTPKGSIVTILNYDDIVSLDNRIDNKIDNSRTTAGQQSDINKSDKNVKNDIRLNNKQKIESFFESENLKEIVESKLIPYENQIWFEEQAKTTLETLKEKMIEYYDTNKKEIKNVKMTFINWLPKDRKQFYKYPNFNQPQIQTIEQPQRVATIDRKNFKTEQDFLNEIAEYQECHPRVKLNIIN